MVADAPMGIPEQALTPSPTALLGPRVRLMGMPLSGFTMRSAVEHILSELSEGRGGWMITPNLDILRRYVQDPAFQAMANRANVCVADGMSLVWAAHLAGTPLPERVAGSSLIEPLCRAAADAGRRLYFLGGSPGRRTRRSLGFTREFPFSRWLDPVVRSGVLRKMTKG